MDNKKTATLKEIANYFGISKQTLRRKLKPYWKMFDFDKRKAIYYPAEIRFIKKILKDE